MRPFSEEAILRLAEAEARDEKLHTFVAASNYIEEVEEREPTHPELAAHRELLARPRMGGRNGVTYLERFVLQVEPKAKLRRRVGQNVSLVEMGKVVYRPQEGGKVIEDSLVLLLDSIEEGQLSPAEAHMAYETLHPFTDGNGRSGRALWAWHMEKVGLDPFSLPFLHRFYYQALQSIRPAEL